MIRLRTPSIRYETGLIVASDLEPVHRDQVARRVHRRDEQEDEEDREGRLDRLAGAGAQRHEGAEHPEPGRDHRREDEDHERAGDAGLEVDAEDEREAEVEDRLDQAEHHHAGHVPGEQRAVPASASARGG